MRTTYIRHNTNMKNWDKTGTINLEQHRYNKSGATHIGNYMGNHMHMANPLQHILVTTLGLHQKPHRYDKLGTTHIRDYIREYNSAAQMNWLSCY